MGMELISQQAGPGEGETTCLLGYKGQDTYLELRSHNDWAQADDYTHNKKDTYWKIGITLPDVDLACRRLNAKGIAVSEPAQFRDIGYLCHLSDPEGFCIELLQHDFEANFHPTPVDPRQPLGSKPNLGQITLRVKDIEANLHFYCNLLGMKLLSRQAVEPYGFTLYFLGCTDENPPNTDLDAVDNREWLWKRPYTTLELQHFPDRNVPHFQYRRHGLDEPGFRGLGFVYNNLSELARTLEKAGYTRLESGFEVKESDAVSYADPNGNPIFIKPG